ncbi:RNA polymerase sigma factor [Panacagrimonas sp.]|uniref:RNA polymerase sigma factor n=1 Tax=Panacagrimonas sp. TaxID=2480088 RepID=UPI003B516D41
MKERDEFEWLLEQEIPHLRRYARALTHSVTEADDLVQDCLERALRKWFRWQMQGRLRSWLFRMLYRLHLNRLRTQRRQCIERSLDDMATEPAQAAQQEQRAECLDILQVMRGIPEDQRQAILLVALEDMSYDEAAWVLAIPVGTLRSRISRGRSALRDLCGEATPVQAEPRANLRRVK